MTYRRTIIPPIKCQGIKTKLVPWIRSIAPDFVTGRWIEPFMGSGVVALNIQPDRALLADSNPHIIRFYQAIQNKEVDFGYAKAFLQREGTLLEKTEGEHYYTVRDRFNKHGDPMDFLFLNRACFNGMIRFNRNGGFNVPFCRKPKRFAPAYITKICNQIKAISDILYVRSYEFLCQDFVSTISSATNQDVIYCDPPYIGRHTDYYNGWDDDHELALNRELKDTQARFILSTWHSNDFRSNEFLSTIWSDFPYLTREHFYHVGAKEDNRNPMLEALVTNFNATYMEPVSPKAKQLILFEKVT